MLVFVISWCILKNYKNGLLGAVIGGFLLDLFSSTFFGVDMICLTITMIITYLVVSNFVDMNNIYTRIGVISLATFFYYLLMLLIFFILEFFDLKFMGYLQPLWQKILGNIALNIILMFLFYRFVNFFRDFSIRYNDKIKART
jgi:rod shape-determining protein MreD